MEALEKAIQVVGGQTKLARALGKSQGHVWAWLRRDHRVPAEYCIRIEQAIGGQVIRYELRPDVFGEDTRAACDSHN